MFKQAVILALSVSGIALAVASTWNSEEAPAEPVAAAPEKPVKKAAPVVDPDEDYYADEDEDFVFGEPVAYSDDDEKPAKAKSEPSEYKAAAASKPAPSSNYVPPVPARQNAVNRHKSPADGEPGSKSNPVNVGRSNPTTPPVDAEPVARLD